MVARLKERWNAELAEWRARPLGDLSAAYTVHGLPTFGRWSLQIKPQRGFAARLLLSQSAEQIFLRWVRRSSQPSGASKRQGFIVRRRCAWS